MTIQTDDVTPSSRRVTGTRKLSRDWQPFAVQLAAVLGELQEDQFLIISVKQEKRYVQFAGQGSFGLRIETTSNAYLDEPERLDRKQISALRKAGWDAPTGKPGHSTPELDPDGSPNYFADFPAPVAYESVAQLAVNTLAEILRVPHPGFLEYEAFDETGKVFDLAALGLKAAQRKEQGNSPEDHSGSAARLLETLRKSSGIGDLDFDSDGDIALRYGSAVVYARVIGEPPLVHLFSFLLREVEEQPEIYVRLNELNGQSLQTRFYFREGSVYGMTELSAAPYIEAQVARSFERFCQVADTMGSLLQNEFGGRTAFVEWAQSATLQ